MRKRIVKTSFVMILMALNQMALAGGTPQETVFTYQGLLKQGGVPASGTFDLRFQLWDAPTGGTQIGSDIDVPTLVVTDGLFNADLNFGTQAFNGSARWLQVQVITNGGATVTPLTPRQPVNVTPYAIFAFAVNGPNITNLHASNFTSGTVPSAQLGGAYANALALTNGSNALAGTFSGSGASITNLNATNIASGTLSIARLPGGGGWPLTSILDMDSGTLAVDPVNTRVGIGVSVPGAQLHIRANAPSIRLQDTASDGAQSGYISFRNVASTETGWIGYGTAGSNHFTVLNNRTDGDVVITPGPSGDVIVPASDVGIGITGPGYFLHVNGTAGKPGGGSWATASDARLKKNVAALHGELDSLLALRGVEFEYINPKAINEPAGRRIGMIAQEVEREFPDWVSEGSDGYKRLAFSGFEAMTVEAMRELRAEQDAEIKRLRADIAELKAMLKSLMDQGE